MTIIVTLPNGIEAYPQIWVYGRITKVVGDWFPEDNELKETIEMGQIGGIDLTPEEMDPELASRVVNAIREVAEEIIEYDIKMREENPEAEEGPVYIKFLEALAHLLNLIKCCIGIQMPESFYKDDKQRTYYSYGVTDAVDGRPAMDPNELESKYKYSAPKWEAYQAGYAEGLKWTEFPSLIIYSNDMKPNYQPHQKVIVENISASEIKQGDVVWCGVLGTLRLSAIKRVIALPGQTIAIQAGIIYINGSPLVENYSVIPDPEDNLAPQTLAAHQYYVLEDNRSEKRMYAPQYADQGGFIIDEEQIWGRVIP